MTFFNLDRRATTGKSAPNMEPMRMMKMEAILRERKSLEPPPEPQLTVSSSNTAAVVDAAAEAEAMEVRASATETVDDMFASFCCD